MEEYQKALELNPNIAVSHTNLGNLYFKMEMHDKAIDEHKKAIEIKPDFAEAYNNLGYVYFEQRKYGIAVNEFKKAIELKPGYISAHNNLGKTYINVGLRDKAKEEYEIVKSLVKKNKRVQRTF
jgi:tetratricopeptide (TPR) repeat protein